MKYVIIGAGPAGLNAAATLRRVDSGGDVTLLSGEATPPYAKMVLPYLLAGLMEEKNLRLPGLIRHSGHLKQTPGRLSSTTGSSLPLVESRSVQSSRAAIIPSC
jgi:hypothetical protein